MTMNIQETTEKDGTTTVNSGDGTTATAEDTLLGKEVSKEEKSKNTPTTSDVEEEQSASKKRSRSEDGDVILSPEALAKMNRAERKRHRERKRRNDVNKGFDDLMELLLEIDPVVRAEAEERASHRGSGASSGNSEEAILSRVELIGRAVEVLRKTHLENEERKVMIRHLLSQQAAPVTAPTMSLPNLQQVRN